MNEIKDDETYVNYRDKVERYVLRRVKHTHDTEDLVSSIFLKIYDKIDTFDSQKASLSTWIYSITRNTVIDYFRTQKKDCQPNVEKIDDYSLPGQIETQETLAELANALRVLDSRQRNLIILHYYDGKTLKEIATAFGMSYINAKIIHKKALRNLKKLLKW